jgi:hypothetical protein
MRPNLNVILTVAGVAALLTSSAVAQSARHHLGSPPTLFFPSDARGSLAPWAATEGGLYAPISPIATPRLEYGFER